LSAVVLVVFGITMPCHVNYISFSPIFIRTFKSIICIQCMFCLTNLLCLFLSDELVPGDTKPKLDLQSDKKKGSRTLTSWILHQSYLLLFTVGPDSLVILVLYPGIQVQLDLKSNGNGLNSKKMPAGRSKASGSAGKAAGGSGGKRKR
jgi:hypothetical protein